MGNDIVHYLETAPLMAVGAALLAGVATSFTPCVYPIIPITVTYIGARGSISRVHSFTLASLYALGLAIMYAALGMVAALTGQIFGMLTQSPYVYLVVGNIILFFGLNMLGLFSVPIPRFLAGGTASTERKGFLGAFLLGVTSGWVVGPCTAPVLATILTYVSTQKNVVLGGTMLFSFAIGMCLLIVVAGTFSGFLTSLPKSGAWMEKIKKGFGWLMIGLGEYFIVRAGIYW